MSKKLRILVFTFIHCAYGVAQFKVVNQALKEINHKNPNTRLAQGYMRRALEDSISNKYARTWYSAGLIEHRIYDLEKAKEIPDYNKMYDALYNAHNYFIKASELDILPNKKGFVSPEYVNDIKKRIRDKEMSLVEGGAYFWDIKLFDKAYKMFDTYVNIPYNDLFKNAAFRPDSSYYRVVFYKGLACSKLRNPRQTISIYESLKGSGYRESEIYQYITFEYRNMKDMANFERTLIEGANKFPGEEYFVNTLVDFYIRRDNYDDAVTFIDKAIAQNPSPSFYNIKGRLLENSKKHNEAAFCYIRAIDGDSLYIDAIGNAGRIYYNKAIDILDEAYNKSDEDYDHMMQYEVRPLYQQSLPFYERAYRLNPDERMYYRALRDIYYRLGMMKESDALTEDYQKRQDSPL